MGSAGTGPAACEHKLRLLQLYSIALADHERAIQVLSSFMGVLSSLEYKRIRAYVEESDKTLEEARKAVDKHVAEHDC